jgi:thioredoxin-like negative regulator of GroEL
MADEEVELTDEQRGDLQLTESLNERMPLLVSREDYDQRVRDDIENLVVVAIVSSQCPHSRALRATLNDMSRPRKATANARFFRTDIQQVPDIASAFSVSAVPAVVFLLKGVVWQTHVGSNADKILGLFRNNMIKRNEIMREYDLAKIAKPEEEAAEGEEGEEGEEGAEE